MSRKLTEGCYSKLQSAPQIQGAKIASTVTYYESLKVLEKDLINKQGIVSKLNEATRLWLINKE